jgi:hypothetical protein
MNYRNKPKVHKAKITSSNDRITFSVILEFKYKENGDRINNLVKILSLYVEKI